MLVDFKLPISSKEILSSLCKYLIQKVSSQWAEAVAEQLGHPGTLYLGRGKQNRCTATSNVYFNILWPKISHKPGTCFLVNPYIAVLLLCLLSLLHCQSFWHLCSHKCHRNLSCKWAKGCITTNGGLTRAFVAFSSRLVHKKQLFSYQHSMALPR